MTHPCRVPLHSISRKIINRAKSLAAELAGGLAAGSQVVLQEQGVCVCVHVLACVFVCASVHVLRCTKRWKTDRFKDSKTLFLSLSLSLSPSPETIAKNKQQNKEALTRELANTHTHTHYKGLMREHVCLDWLALMPSISITWSQSVSLSLCPYCSVFLCHTHSLSLTHTRAQTTLWSVRPWWMCAVTTQTPLRWGNVWLSINLLLTEGQVWGKHTTGVLLGRQTPVLSHDGDRVNTVSGFL